MKQAKRVLSVLLAVFLLAGCLPMTASAEEPVTSGWCGDTVYWSFHADDGTLIISGRGAMYDYYYEDDFADWEVAPWMPSSHDDAIVDGEAICQGTKSIVIGDGITHIGSFAFSSRNSGSDMEHLESVTIPNTVVSIGNGAFSMNAPKEIFIPASVQQIGTGYDSSALGQSPDDYGCEVFSSTKLQKIVVDAKNEYYKSIDGVLYKKGNNPALIQYPLGKTLDELFLPSDLKILNLSDAYFGGFPETIHVPSSVNTVIFLDALLGSRERKVYFYGNAPEKFNFERHPEGWMSRTTLFYPSNASGWDKFISSYEEWLNEWSSFSEYGIQFQPWTPSAYPATETVNWKNTGGNPGGTNPPAPSGPSGPSGPSDTEKPDDSGDKTPVASKFVDVPASEYYYNAVNWAVEKNIVAGTSDTTFSPNQNCTRGQIVSFLWRAAGKPEPKTTVNPFTDVKSGEYYYKAVLWAYENSIVAGTSATAFSPEQNCTRGQIVTFLWRSAGKPQPKTTVNPFTDVSAGEYYYNAVLWAYENKIVAGTSADKFSPGATCTRAQSVTFLYRDMGK